MLTDTTVGLKKGPNLDYLCKNVNITCSENDQILDFYIKLRLAIAKGGIYILPIENITKHTSIAMHRIEDDDNDQQMQSQALYALLCNETFIPSDFKMAQNCILGKSDNCDGFGALKAMLKVVHPLLNNKRPSNVPPLLSDSNDIHTYAQKVRNYFLLHKLYNNANFAPLEKSRQFLQGLDTDQYTEASLRIRHQLDTTENMGTMLTEDYKLENLAGTIINLSGEYDNVAIVRTMGGTPNDYRHGKSFNHDMRRSSRQPNNKGRRQTTFSKTQCTACLNFGHSVQRCTLLPRVIAIMEFVRKNKRQCDSILEQHKANNTIDAKKNIVRILQNMNILPEDIDSDEYMDNEFIVNTMMDNMYEPSDNCNQSDE